MGMEGNAEPAQSRSGPSAKAVLRRSRQNAPAADTNGDPPSASPFAQSSIPVAAREMSPPPGDLVDDKLAMLRQKLLQAKAEKGGSLVAGSAPQVLLRSNQESEL